MTSTRNLTASTSLPTALATIRTDGFKWFDATGQNIVPPVCSIAVDSRRGNDSNPGTLASPKKTIAAAASFGAISGAVICLARGSSWREALTISADNVTVGDYGAVADPRPILRADDPLVASYWSLTSGKTYTYQAAVTLPGANQNKQWFNVWENGVPLTFVADQATVEATPGSYTVTGQTNSSGAVAVSGSNTTTVLYIHTADGTSPVTNGKLYEYSRREYAIMSTGLNTKVLGVETRRPGGHNGSLVLYNLGNTVYDVVARSGSKHAALIGGGLVANSQFIDCFYGTTSADLLVFYSSTPYAFAGTNWTVRNTAISMTAPPTATVNAVYSHSDATGAFGTGTIAGCTITNTSTIMDGETGAPANLVVDGNVLINVVNGVRNTGAVNVTVRNNTGQIIGSGSGLANVTTTTGLFTVDNNRINFTDPSNFIASTALTTSITNNVFFINGVTKVSQWQGITVSNASGALSLSNNIFDASQTIYARAVTITVASMTASNNIYTAQSNAQQVTIGGTALTIGSPGAYVAAMQAFQSGLEAGSVVGSQKGVYAGSVL